MKSGKRSMYFYNDGIHYPPLHSHYFLNRTDDKKKMMYLHISVYNVKKMLNYKINVK